MTTQAALLDRQAITGCLTTKLTNAKTREPDNYADLETLDDFFPPLYLGDRWEAPLNTSPDRAAFLIRYVGTPLTMAQARIHVRERLIPLIWDKRRPRAGRHGPATTRSQQSAESVIAAPPGTHSPRDERP